LRQKQKTLYKRSLKPYLFSVLVTKDPCKTIGSLWPKRQLSQRPNRKETAST
jgi:hypothetical protein